MSARILMISLSALWLAGCSLFGDRSSYEAPDYSVVQSLGPDTEVRTYAPRLVAEATVKSDDPDEGRNDAFRLLFDYISGENRGSEKVSMTVPVQASSGEKIEMTTPVQAAEGDGETTLRFFFPDGYTLDTAPEPLDPRIEIRKLPETTLAVRTYSGSTGEEKLREEQAALFEMLNATEWRPAGEPSAMFYDPPWTLWFARRNEAVIPVMQN